MQLGDSLQTRTDQAYEAGTHGAVVVRVLRERRPRRQRFNRALRSVMARAVPATARATRHTASGRGWVAQASFTLAQQAILKAPLMAEVFSILQQSSCEFSEVEP
jgi:hypothetical protein